MIHSKSIRILKALSKEELKQFSDFVRSPFFNKNRNLIKLFDLLKKYHPRYEIENEMIYSKIYPGKEYHHANMKKLMSENFIIMEKFLLQLRMKRENFVTDTYLLEDYMDRKLNELFFFKLKKINKKLEELNTTNSIYTNPKSIFYDRYHFEDLKDEFHVRNGMIKKTPLEPHIKRSESALCFFLNNLVLDLAETKVLRLSFNKVTEVLISELIPKSLDLKIFLKCVSDNKIKNDLIVLQINIIWMMLYPEDKTYFKQAKHLMLSNYDNSLKETHEVLSMYCLFLGNYCIEMIQKGKQNFRIDLFEIYKYTLKIILNNTVKNSIKIDSTFYVNIIQVGIVLSELEWVEKFIKDNTKYLEEKDKEKCYNYAKAHLEFEKQNYEESLKHSSKLKIRTPYNYKLGINMVTLKCYFELSLYDEAFSLIDSSKHYLTKTNDLNIIMKECFSKVLLIIYKFFKLKTSPNIIVKSDLLNLKSEIADINIIDNKWLMQKIEEFEKSISKKSLPGELYKKPQSKKFLKQA